MVPGRRGIKFRGGSYEQAGSWSVLLQLRDHDPPFIRESARSDDRGQLEYVVMITEAGIQFYEANEDLHDLFYPPN
jgi:hypothetical protein